LLFVLFHVQLTAQVCCLSYFLLHSKFFKGKVKSGIFGGFIVVFQVGFLKHWCLFLLGPIKSTLKIIMDVYLNILNI